MKPQIIINEIDRISKIKDPQECQEEIIELNRLIQTPRIKHVKRGNYYYFYSVLEYRYDKDVKHSRESKREKIGRLTISNYEQQKIIINRLVQEKNKEELIKFLEDY